jgi:hypothetical protein
MLAGLRRKRGLEWPYGRGGGRVRLCADAIDDVHSHLLNAKQLWLGYTSAVDVEACYFN